MKCQYSSGASAKAGVAQGSIFGPLFFLIFTNGLSDNLVSNPKPFADGTSLFSVAQNITLSAKNLNEKWKFQRKMILLIYKEIPKCHSYFKVCEL